VEKRVKQGYYKSGKRAEAKGRRIRGKPKRPWRERQGEWTELRFMSEAVRRGFTVLRPWNRSSVYDVVLEQGRRFPRVQVKSAGLARKLKWARPERGAIYVFNTRRHEGGYRKGNIDFYALYIVPRDVWYIVPYADIGAVQILCVFPDSRKHRLERYRGAWELLYGAGE